MGDSTTDVDRSFDTWKTEPTPPNLKTVVDHLQPTITKAVNTFVQRASPIVHDRARLIAADAVRSFDPQRGASLDTHVYRQLQRLQRMAPQIHDPMPEPEQMRVDRSRIYRAVQQVTDEIGREPSDEEIAERAKLPINRVIKVRQKIRIGMPQSMIEEAGDEDDDAPDLIAQQTRPEDDWLDAVYHDLGDIDRVILMHRTGYRGAPVTSNQQIAQMLKMSGSAVTQRAKRIQQKLDSFYGPTG